MVVGTLSNLPPTSSYGENRDHIVHAGGLADVDVRGQIVFDFALLLGAGLNSTESLLQEDLGQEAFSLGAAGGSRIGGRGEVAKHVLRRLSVVIGKDIRAIFESGLGAGFVDGVRSLGRLEGGFLGAGLVALFERRDLVLHRIDHVLAPRQAPLEGFSHLGGRLELLELGQGIRADRANPLAQFDHVLFFRRVSELEVHLRRLACPLVADRVRLGRKIVRAAVGGFVVVVASTCSDGC